MVAPGVATRTVVVEGLAVVLLVNGSAIRSQFRRIACLLTTWLPMGVTLTPVGVTMVGVTTLMAEVDGVVVVPVIFCVAAAAAARAWIPDI